MSENMICPACNHFQPKAEECVKCGVVVAKVQQQAASPSPAEPSPSGDDATSRLPLPAIIAGVLVLAVGGYLLVGSGGEEPAPEPAPRPAAEQGSIQKMTAQLDEANTVVPRANTQETIRALVQRFDLLAVRPQGFKPPSSEEGLSVLVDKGLVRPEQIVDAWERELVYELVPGVRGPVGQDYGIKVYSVGPDGIDGTEDDVRL